MYTQAPKPLISRQVTEMGFHLVALAARNLTQSKSPVYVKPKSTNNIKLTMFKQVLTFLWSRHPVCQVHQPLLSQLLSSQHVSNVAANRSSGWSARYEHVMITRTSHQISHLLFSWNRGLSCACQFSCIHRVASRLLGQANRQTLHNSPRLLLHNQLSW